MFYVNEFSFVWVKDFNFNYFNNDYAGDGDSETFRLFNEFASKASVDKTILLIWLSHN